MIRQPLRHLRANEDVVDELPVGAVSAVRFCVRGCSCDRSWLPVDHLAPYYAVMLHRQTPVEVTEDQQRPPGLQSTVDPVFQGGYLLGELATGGLKPVRSVLGPASFILLVAEAAGLEMNTQYINAAGSALELNGDPVPEISIVQGGDVGLAFGLHAPAYRRSGLQCAPSPGEFEMGGGGVEHLPDKVVIHFLQS